MRTILLQLFLALTVASQGQFGTVYIIPPTNGCNGVWAAQATSVYCSPVSPYTFVAEPSGCVQLSGWGEEMGVFLIPLCAMPCSLTVTAGDGTICSGSTSDAPIGISENHTAQVQVSIQDGSIDVMSDITLPGQQLRVLDACGRVHRAEWLASGQRWNLPAPAASGVYIIVLGEGDTAITRRFTILL